MIIDAKIVLTVRKEVVTIKNKVVEKRADVVAEKEAITKSSRNSVKNRIRASTEKWKH